MPFGPKCEHGSMASCVEAMQGKVDDPGAYCAALMRRTEEHCKALEDAIKDIEANGYKSIGGVDGWVREKDLQALDDYKSGKRAAPVMYKANGYVLPEAESKAQQVSERVFVASEESEDRMGDIIPVAAWNLDTYLGLNGKQANPMYLYGHNHDILPIGIVPRAWVDGKRLLNTVKFDERDEFAKQVKSKVEGGFLRAESVGFRPLEFEHRKDAHDGILFTKVELLEISIVPIPAHPAALALGYGAKHPAWGDMAMMLGQMQEMLVKLEGMKNPGKGQSTDEIHAEIMRATREALNCC